MLISFTFENWMSFRNKTSFTMIASRELRHNGRVPKIGKSQSRVLPVSAIYGGNASGKSNFFNALGFAKNLIISGTSSQARIGVMPFLLEKSQKNKPTSFCFEILANETIYRYSFTASSREILQENLVEIGTTNEKLFYNRQGEQYEFGTALTLGDDEKFLKFVSRGTRNNQLFLTNAISQNVNKLAVIYNWFRNTLVLISPDTRFASFELFFEKGGKLQKEISKALRELDTGIEELIGEELHLQDIKLDDELRNEILEKVDRDTSVKLSEKTNNDRYIITNENDKLIAKKLVAYHSRTDDGRKVKFQINQESDGTQRLIDLLPAFLGLARKTTDRVFIIDEIGRSLHVHVLISLLEMYLSTCSRDSRSQLILTTHNVQLMTQQLLRRDEMWLTERDSNGVSNLYSMGDFVDLKYNDDVRKRYLQGQLGGIPRIFLTNYDR